MAEVEGRPWIDALPAPLERHAQLLRRLLDRAEADERLRALELQCSVARGAGDELSDLDAGLWVADEHLDDVAAELDGLAARLGPVHDHLTSRLAGWPYLFADFADGVQLDLLVRPASQAKGRVPDSVVLLDRDGLLEAPFVPAAATATAADLEEWSFQGWLALSNLAKYLRRGSFWEARASLEESRANLLKLHAAQAGVPYPGYGMTSLLDEEAPLPPRLEETLAALSPDELRRAAEVCAELLAAVAERPLAAVVQERLALLDQRRG